MKLNLNPDTYEKLLTIANENNISIPALISILLDKTVGPNVDHLQYYREVGANKMLWPVQETFTDIINETRI